MTGLTDDDDSALHPLPGTLSVYVIYDHPRDLPDWFVVRPWDVVDGKARMRTGKLRGEPVAGLFRQLDDARAYCEQFGLTKMARSPDDDPTVVETWL